MAKSRPGKNQSERSDLPCHIIMDFNCVRNFWHKVIVCVFFDLQLLGFSLEICSLKSYSVKLLFLFDLDCLIIWAMQITNTQFTLRQPLKNTLVQNWTHTWPFLRGSRISLTPLMSNNRIWRLSWGRAITLFTGDTESLGRESFKTTLYKMFQLSSRASRSWSRSALVYRVSLQRFALCPANQSCRYMHNYWSCLTCWQMNLY